MPRLACRPFRCHFSSLQLIAHGQHGGSAYRRLHGPGQHGHRRVQEASVHMQTSTMPATMTHSHRCACRLSKQHTALPERARGPRRVLWQAARAQPYASKSKAGAGPWRLPQSKRQRCAAAPALLPNKPSPQFLLFHTCCNCCWPSVRAPRRCTWRSAAWRLNDSLAWTILWLVTSSCVYTDLARSCNIVFAMLFDDAALEATFGEFLVTAQAGALLTSGLGICVRLCCQCWRDKR